MADSRFSKSSENDVDTLKKKATNDNTSRSTATWLKVWLSWADERGINRKLEEFSAEELDKVLQRFYTEVRSKDGKQYEPESLKVMLAALDRYLRDKNYPYSIIKDRQFHQSKQVLEGKARLFREQGKGKRPNASNPLTSLEEENLWKSGKLGNVSPRVLLQTLWWILTQHFGLRGRQEHHSMSVEDFRFCQDDDGREYMLFNENPTKTRQGGLNTKRRAVIPKMFATGGPRCPVALFKEFLSHRPLEWRENGPFYLAAIDSPKTSVWYKKQRLGVHSIDQMMKSIIENTTVNGQGKRLTNHSARKTVVKKLKAAKVERQAIIQVTGHASEHSLQDYDEGDEEEQRNISNIISNHHEAQVIPNNTSSTCSFAANQWQSSMAQNVNNFHNCQVTLNVLQGQQSSPSKAPSSIKYKRVKRILESDSESQ